MTAGTRMLQRFSQVSRCLLSEEKEEMEHLQAYNKKLLSNILPVHVAEFFMSGDKNDDVSNKKTEY